MDEALPSQITRILDSAAQGDPRATAELFPIVYDELRRLARARLGRERPGQTLQPTALVNEAFLRLVGTSSTGWNSRGHFFGAAALAMRRILIDQARRKKHGKDGEAGDDVGSGLVIEEPVEDMLALDEALQRLEQEDALKGRIVNLRYFAGLSAEETAAALDLSLSTVEREWRYTRAWLFRQLSPPGAPDRASEM